MKLRIVGSVEWVLLAQFGEVAGELEGKVMRVGRALYIKDF